MIDQRTALHAALALMFGHRLVLLILLAMLLTGTSLATANASIHKPIQCCDRLPAGTLHLDAPCENPIDRRPAECINVH